LNVGLVVYDIQNVGLVT